MKIQTIVISELYNDKKHYHSNNLYNCSCLFIFSGKTDSDAHISSVISASSVYEASLRFSSDVLKKIYEIRHSGNYESVDFYIEIYNHNNVLEYKLAKHMDFD